MGKKETKRVQLTFDGTNGWYYSLADTCTVIGKARSTIMRLLPLWESVTKHKPIKDHSGRWFFPEKSVHALRDKPELYLRLAGRATKWEDEQRKLRVENLKLRNLIKTNVPKSTLKRLKIQLPDLLGDIDG